MAHAGRTTVPPGRVRRRLRHRAVMWRLLSRRHEDWLPFPLALWLWLGPAALAWVVAGAGLPVLIAVVASRPAELPGEWPRLESALREIPVWPAVLEGVAWGLLVAGAWSYAGYALFTCAPARRVRIWRDALVREYASWRGERDRDIKGERIRAGRCGRVPRRVFAWTGAARTGAASWRRLHAMRWARADEVLTLARRLAVISAGVVSGLTLAWRYGLLPAPPPGTPTAAPAVASDAGAPMGLGDGGLVGRGLDGDGLGGGGLRGGGVGGGGLGGGGLDGGGLDGGGLGGGGLGGGGFDVEGWGEVARAVAGDWLGILGGIVPGVELPERLGLARPEASEGPLAYDVTMAALGLAVLLPLACYVVQMLRDPRDLDPEWPFEDGPAVIAVAQRIGWEDGDLPRSAGGWTGAFTDAARRLEREEITPPPGSVRWTAEDVWNEVTDALDDPPPEWLPPPHQG